jgi:hypothetical protein
MTDISSGHRPGETHLSVETDPAPSGTGAAVGTAKEQATNVASSVADHAREVGAEAAGQAKDLLSDAKGQLRSQAQDQSARVATLLGELSDQMRSMADAGEPGAARDIVAQLADRARGLADRLDDGGLDRMLDDTRRFARNRPGAFLAAAAATGFVAARLVRNADTHSLVDAAKPDGATNGSGPTDPTPTQPSVLGPTGTVSSGGQR